MDLIQVILSAYEDKRINKHSKTYKMLCKVVDAENKLRSTFDDKQKELYHEFDILTLEYQGLQDIELIKFILEFFHTVNNPMDKVK